MAFGQERLLVTPLQMAMVAGTIGNGGILMRPYVVDKIVSPERQDAQRTKPTKIRRAVSPATARDVSAMMVRAVQAGTGTAAQISGPRRSAARPERPRRASTEATRRGSSPSRAPDGAKPQARDRRRAPEPVAHGRRDGRADRAACHAGTPDPDGESLTYGDPWRRNDLTGTLFAGRYRLERKLGSGGMADVWLAEDQELGRRVAVKILHERYANDEQFVERFRREATHAAGLSHPNIVSIYDRGVADGSYFIVMEYIEGRTLKELIVTRGHCPVPVAISYTRQILAALRYAHQNGIIHRDIKPHNVIVDREGRVKVADFGIARAGASEMTEAGSIVGTAQYLSPEQARGAPVDESSDLYSTGIVLYELLTGAVPFTGETPVEIAMKHLSQTPEAPLGDADPRSRTTSTSSSCARSRRSRPTATATAAELDRDLELVARGDAVGERDRERRDDGAGRARARSTRRRRRRGAAPVAGAPEAPSAATSATAPTTARSRGGEASGRGCSRLGAVLAIAVGGCFLYDNVQNQIETTSRSPVRQYTGIVESKAVDLIPARRLRAEGATSSEQRHARRHRLRAATDRGHEPRPRRHRHDPRLHGQEDRQRARRRRLPAHGRRHDA